MVIVERLTKYAHFFSLSRPLKSSTVATTFMEIVQNLHGSPKIIVSDRDLIFTRHFWRKLFSCFGTQLAHISSYHPQYDGQNEIVKKTMEGYLHCFVSDKQTQWSSGYVITLNCTNYAYLASGQLISLPCQRHAE
jgi:hypothetical protein